MFRHSDRHGVSDDRPTVHPVIPLILTVLVTVSQRRNAILLLARKPTGMLSSNCPHGPIGTPGAPCWPAGRQFGNPGGRPPQPGRWPGGLSGLTRVDHAIENRRISRKRGAGRSPRRCHTVWRVAARDWFVVAWRRYSHERHIHAFVRMWLQRNVPSIAACDPDGRDMPPKRPSIDAMQAVCAETGARIATVMGLHAMDRDPLGS